MGWQLTDDVDKFAEQVLPVLELEPERHTIAFTVIDNVRRGLRWSDDPMCLGWHESHSAIDGVVLMTPPFPLLLALVPDAALPDLVETLRAAVVPLGAVNAERALVDKFVAAWTAGTQLQPRVVVEQRLYRLGRLQPPPYDVPGIARLAGAADLDLALGWFEAFTAEATPEGPRADQRPGLVMRLNDGQLWLWEVDEQPVAMAGRTSIIAGIARVGPVYTPPERRRHGYGTAVTAACTLDAMERGAAGVVLFTDLANPTSNAIYQSIGYRPVTDRVIVEFGAG